MEEEKRTLHIYVDAICKTNHNYDMKRRCVATVYFGENDPRNLSTLLPEEFDGKSRALLKALWIAVILIQNMIEEHVIIYTSSEYLCRAVHSWFPVWIGKEKKPKNGIRSSNTKLCKHVMHDFLTVSELGIIVEVQRSTNFGTALANQVSRHTFFAAAREIAKKRK